MTRSSTFLPARSLSNPSHASGPGILRNRVLAAVLGAARLAVLGGVLAGVLAAVLGGVLGGLALRVAAEEGETRRALGRRVPAAELRRAPEGDAATPEDDAAKIEFFRQKVAPVLKEHCFECHARGADEVKGDLLLDSQAALLKGGANGPAVVPGDVEASFLIRAIRYTEDDYKMPPRGKLDDDVIRDLEKWIKDGAKSNLPKESP